jgi:hypothetical protein
MANLGSTDTPAAARSIDLPGGYAPAIEEDSGDLIINDSNGNTTLRWDDANGAWQLAAPLDTDGTDLADSAGPGTLYDASAGVVLQAVLGGPPGSLTSYPLPIGDLDSPYPPGDIADVDGYPFANSDLANDSVTVSGGNGVKNGGNVALGDSVTLDVEPADVAGALLVDDGTDALAVDEPGIDHDNIDQSTVTADDHHPRIQVSDSGAAVLTQPTDVNLASSLDVTDDGDGTITVDVAVDTMEFNTDESGTVTAGNSGMVYAHGLPDGDTMAVLRAGLLLADGQPAPTDLDLILATLDGAGGGTKQTTIVAGDGTAQATVEGDPVASYENTSGGEETVAVLVDNGNYNAGTGADQDIVADAHGEVV